MADRRDPIAWLTIVPEAHVRLLDFGLQHEMYDVFHRSWGARIGHILGTGMIHTGVAAALVWLGEQVLPGLGLGLAAVGFFVQWSYALRLDRLVGLAMLLPLALVAGGVAITLSVMGPQTWLASLVLVLAGTMAQAFSHVFEPLPPPWSGDHRFRAVSEVLRERGPTAVPGLMFLMFLGHLLELWAAGRILPLQVLFVLLELGYRPDLREATHARRREILSDPRTGWGTRASTARARP